MVCVSCAYCMARWMQEADFKNNQMNVDYNESDMGNAERRVMGEWRECYDASLTPCFSRHPETSCKTC